METRTVHIPRPIVDPDNDQKVVVRFGQLIAWCVDTQPQFLAKASSLVSSVRILDAVEESESKADAEAKDEAGRIDWEKWSADVELKKGDWQLLRDALEAPKNGEWPIAPARKLLPFIQAVLDA